MSRDLYRLAEQRFRVIVVEPPLARDRLLDDLETDDPEVARLVRELISADEDAPAWLDQTGLWGKDEIPRSPDVSGRIPHPLPKVPGFELIEQIGVGGMGVVYRARQLAPDREVAIKLVRPGAIQHGPLRDRLFRREAEALGRLHHPNIAAVYGVFTANDGATGERPCFVMEYIEGETLMAFVREHRPSHEQRVLLIAQIAEAMGHAHSLGIVHRDLKPGNVLVRSGAAAKPTVLDFGIAKILTESQISTSDTITAADIIGTIPYVAPEQIGIAGNRSDVDARADVHALGVLLFEVLTDELPYAGVRDQPLAMALHAFATGEPGRLRQARARGDSSVDGGQLAWRDLEAIIATALARDPAKRYADADALAADLRRWLDGSAVTARRETVRDRVGRFVAKNRALAASIAAIFVLLAGATVATTMLSTRAMQAEGQATERADQLAVENDRLQRIDDFFVDILSSASYEQSQITSQQPEDLRALDLIDWISRNITAAVGDRPETEIRLRLAIVESYFSTRKLDEAEAELARCKAIAQGIDPDSVAHLEIMRTEAAILGRRAGRTQEPQDDQQRLAFARKVAAEAERIEAWPQYIALCNDITNALWGTAQYEEALLWATETAENAERLLGDHVETSTALNNNAVVLQLSGKPAESLPLFERCLAMKDRIGRAHRPGALVARANILNVLRDLGRDDELLPGFEDLLDRRLKSLPEHHFQVLDNRRIIGLLLREAGRLEESLAMLELAKKSDDDTSADIGWISPSIDRERIKTLRSLGRLDEADALYGAETEKLVGDENLVYVLELDEDRGLWLLEQGDPAGAEAMLRSVLEQTPERKKRIVGKRKLYLARAMIALDRPGEAASFLTEALDSPRASPDLQMKCLRELIEAHTAMGNEAEVREYRERLGSLEAAAAGGQ